MSRIGRWLERRRLERELDKELRFHLERQIDDLVASGVEPEEARRRARLMLGGLEQTKESCRDARGTRWAEDFLTDCRYGMRVLRRSPAFACTAVASLALAIGANTAIFSLVDLVMLRNLPVREPERLVEFQKFHPTYGRGNISYPRFEQFQQELRSFDGLLAQATLGRREIRSGGQVENAFVELVSGSYYDVLGVHAIAGRIFGTETDGAPGASPVAVISYRYWKNRFGAGADAVGRTFELNRTVFTIIGVTPPGFTGLATGQAPDITIPLSMDAAARGGESWLRRPGFNWLSVMGRLRGGVKLEEARAEVKALYGRIVAGEAARQEREFRRAAALAQRMELEPAGRGFDELRRRFSEPLALLMGAVALVLLIGCANLANLLLARAAARQREIAVRLAIGAGRGRVVRQMLTEGLVVAALGGSLGVALAYWLGNGLVTMMSNGGPRMALEVRPDLRVLGFAALASLGACLLFSLAPAVQATRVSVQPVLAEVRGGRWRLGKSLIVAQGALSLVLVIGAGLFGRTLVHLYTLDAGFARHGVLMFTVNTAKAGYSGARLCGVQKQMLREMESLPGAVSASLSFLPPLSGGGWDGNLFVEGYTHAPGEDDTSHLNEVGPGYFRTLGTPVLLGREFDARDGAGSPKVAVVNEAFANYYFRGRPPLGKWISLGRERKEPVTIVGVVKNVKYRDLRREIPRTVYFAAMQDERPDRPANFSYFVRAVNPDGMRRGIEGRLAAIDPGLRVLEARTMEEHVARSILTERMMALLGGFFGFLGLVVASIGIYGVMAFQVARRRKEIGIRLAVGASPRQVVGMVLGETGKLIGAACILGAAGALALTRLAEGLLFGVKAADPATFAMAAGVVAATGLAAAYLPGRVAARLNPVETLRCD